jgi:hypothetical protein
VFVARQTVKLPFRHRPVELQPPPKDAAFHH